MLSQLSYVSLLPIIPKYDPITREIFIFGPKFCVGLQYMCYN